MRYLRVLAAVALGLWIAAAAQTEMSVDQLFAFIRSSTAFLKQGTMTDKQLADFLAKSKLSERLDDRSVEQMQALGIGPLTSAALRKLRDQSQSLAAAKPIEPPPDPRLAPPPNSEEQGAILDEARRYALAYSQQLPDFICLQTTWRYQALRPGLRPGSHAGEEPSWQLVDKLGVRLSYFQQKEDYKLVLLNDAPTNRSYDSAGGARTMGDFGTMMKEVFEPSTEARFEWDHWGKLRDRLTMVFSYRVMEARSKWHVVYDNRLEVVPAYQGFIHLDKETHEIVRVTLAAQGLPPDFPVKSAETILDYAYTDLSGHPFLLPSKSESLLSDSQIMSKNDSQFSVYRKYSAESELTFDYPTVEPLPDDKTKEAPPPAAPASPAKGKKK